jgi:hypothetical protein
VDSVDVLAARVPVYPFLRINLVRVFPDELGVAARAIVDRGMVVVAHRAREQYVDLAAQRGGDQAVPERVGGRRVGAEQELALGAAAVIR